MWPTNFNSFRPGNSFFTNAPFAEAFGSPFGNGAPSFGVPFGNDMFNMSGNASIPMGQMLPYMMMAIIQQQLALMFLAEMLSNGGGQRNNQGCGGGGQQSGRFPNRNWGNSRRMPPGSWGGGDRAQGSGGYVPITTTGGTGTLNNNTATFDSVSNRGQRNQMVTGRVMVNGREYQFRSGGGGRGNLPPGDYTVTPHMWNRSDRTMSVGGEGYSFALSDKYDPRVGGNRSLLRIHPDGGGAGTIGCMGIVGNASTQRQFREDMRAELARNGGRFTLRVGVPPNGA